MSSKHIQDPVKCKFFPFSLEGRALSWFKGLEPNSVSTWEQLQKMFLARFATSDQDLEPWKVLEAVKQGKDETLRKYVERYVKEARSVKEVDCEEKLFWMIHGLAEGSLFRRDMIINNPQTMEEFLSKAQEYMEFEEIGEADHEATEVPKNKEHKEPERRRVTKCIPLNTSRARILAECANTDFKNVKRPDPLVFKERQRSSKKWCYYHNSPGHTTNGCRTLKKDIERMVEEGKLQKYVAKEGEPSNSKARPRHFSKGLRFPGKGKAPAKEWTEASSNFNEELGVESDESLSNSEAEHDFNPKQKGGAPNAAKRSRKTAKGFGMRGEFVLNPSPLSFAKATEGRHGRSSYHIM